VPTSKQRREAAQRRLQRQLERRGELARKRRRNLGLIVTAVAAALVVGAAILLTGVLRDDDTDASADPGAGTTAAVDGSDGTCDFTADASGNPNLTDVGTPPAEVETTGVTTLTMNTNFGAIGLTLDQAMAPCASASMAYLAEQKFFDGTPCHRQTDSEGLKVLQCGDPSGTGSGGPTYDFPTQTTGQETYDRGTLAMANAAQGTDGSQFFLVYGDSQLPPDFTVVGRIDEPGLAVLDQIAANGNDAANGPNDGAPTEPVTIETMVITA
jgi:peptidyl-prolyl cis-trans isomerase B (cyclophilin B)